MGVAPLLHELGRLPVWVLSNPVVVRITQGVVALIAPGTGEGRRNRRVANVPGPATLPAEATEARRNAPAPHFPGAAVGSLAIAAVALAHSSSLGSSLLAIDFGAEL